MRVEMTEKELLRENAMVINENNRLTSKVDELIDLLEKNAKVVEEAQNDKRTAEEEAERLHEWNMTAGKQVKVLKCAIMKLTEVIDELV